MAQRARSRWTGPAAEATLVLVAIGLMLAAAAGGFVVGRATADDNGATAAQTTTGTEAGTTETMGQTETEGETETEGATTAEETETEAATTAGPTGTEDDGGGREAAGRRVFASAGCGSCHTFEPAGSTGTVGPNLGETDLNRNEIEQTVRNGRDGMPAFEGQLSDAEIEAVANFVASG